jgi:hypothetical protein
VALAAGDGADAGTAKPKRDRGRAKMLKSGVAKDVTAAATDGKAVKKAKRHAHGKALAAKHKGAGKGKALAAKHKGAGKGKALARKHKGAGKGKALATKHKGAGKARKGLRKGAVPVPVPSAVQ